MSIAEIKLLIVLVTVFFLYAMTGVQDFARNVILFFFACAYGLGAQILLGPELNLYTGNITLYFSFVSLASVLTWGIGLTSIYIAHLWISQLTRIPPTLLLYFLCGVPILVLIEFIGSNIIHMKLHNFLEYSPLIPPLNAMHAPPWLYVYYVVVALLFHCLVNALEQKVRRQLFASRDAAP